MDFHTSLGLSLLFAWLGLLSLLFACSLYWSGWLGLITLIVPFHPLLDGTFCTLVLAHTPFSWMHSPTFPALRDYERPSYLLSHW